MKNVNEYLPIGSVVKLRNGNKRIMIIGYLPIPTETPNEIYDYSACLFPEGLLTTEQSMVFNHEQIETLYFRGLEDEEQKNFLNKLKSTINSQNNN